MSKELAINEQIKDKEIRVLSPTGEQLGVMPTKEAQAMANSKNLDLVQISPNANPPVCKIMDYGKFRYEQARKEKEAK
ncbi:translation initiation factor IF-3, partial [Clostridioides difficile]